MLEVSDGKVGDALIAALRAALAEQADAGNAAAMRAYMKSAMPYLGVKMPLVQAIGKEVFATHPLGSFVEWRETVLRLWREAAYREERYAAINLTEARRYAAYQTLDALPMYEEMIVSGAWWDLVDGIAGHRIGDLLRRYPEPMRETVLAWSRSPDMWLRRTSIICQSRFKGDTDPDLLYSCIAPNLADKDFFIRKAIGWALREYGKSHPEAVREYVAAHEAELSPLSRREALKHLG
jgi:3-methyladenine DNA glycosylase AlkD